MMMLENILLKNLCCNIDESFKIYITYFCSSAKIYRNLFQLAEISIGLRWKRKKLNKKSVGYVIILSLTWDNFE